MHPTVEQILDELYDQYHSFSPQLRQAAQYIIDHPNDVGVHSMRQLALAADVKPNTFVRLARAVGFDSYDRLREPFRDTLRRGGENFPDRARWLQSLGHDGKGGQLLTQMAATSFSNIETLFAGLSPEDLEALAKRIIDARKAYIMGSGSCFSIAHNFVYVASMALDNLSLIPRNVSPPVDDIARCGSDDVVLAMSFRPYRREIVEAARLAVEQSAFLVSVTDSKTSPLCLGAGMTLVAPTSTPQFFPSVVSVAILMETLLAFVVSASEQTAVSNIDTFHRARMRSQVYWTED